MRAERFFADFDQVWEELTDEQRQAIGAVRAMLSRLGLPYARPEGTRATVHEDSPTVWLQIRHIAAGLKLGVRLSPDEVLLLWPGGQYSRPEWDSSLADALESFLTGRNVVHSERHFRTIVAVNSEVWLDDKIRRWLPEFLPTGGRRRLLRRLPWQAQRIDSTISFARPDALAAPSREDLV